MRFPEPPQSDALERAVDAFRAAWELAHHHLPRSAAIATASGPPPEFIPWFCGHIFLGYLSPARARLLAAHLAPTRMQAHRLDWDAGPWSAPARSAALQETLLRLRALGHLPGWRNEAFAFCTEGCETPLLQAERAGFYFLGMRSDAVHVNGFRADARMWVARRSAAKQVDPGLLDNLCAGGVAAGETLQTCLQRELYVKPGFALQPYTGCAFAAPPKWAGFAMVAGMWSACMSTTCCCKRTSSPATAMARCRSFCCWVPQN